MQFPNVIGQSSICHHLIEMVEANRLSHAILLSGKQGSGVLPLAIGFGQYLVSRQPPKPAVPDLFGNISAESSNLFAWDKKALDLVHPDLHFSYPVIPKKQKDVSISSDYAKEWREFYSSQQYGNVYDWLQFIKADNRQGNITAAECNDIIRKLSLKSFESDFKVLVMWMPEYLGQEGNKLLKIIEEPPPDTLFILAAESENQLMQTIVSRCQVIRVPPLEPEDIEAALQQKLGLEPQKALQLSLMSDGNYHDSLQMAVHEEANWNNLLKDCLNATLLRGATEKTRFAMQNKVVAELAALGREPQKQLLRYFLQLIEQSLRLRVIRPEQLHLPEAEKAFAEKLNKTAGPSTLNAMVQEIEQSIYFIERNANAKLLFHALMLKLRSIIIDHKLITV